MKFSLEWLNALSGYKGSAKGLAELLSSHAFETEVFDSSEFKNIIVAKVVKVDKHPNADRLRIVELTDGKNIISPVVCGAWNFQAGAIVPLALPGALIPHDQHDPAGKSFVLEKTVIRGVESQGMICSAKELGLGNDGAGILILESTQKLGAVFSSKSHLSSVLEIAVPANRPDLLSYRGVAWEVSALTGSKYQAHQANINLKTFPAKVLKIRMSESKLCPKYSAMRLTQIVVGQSPKFIQDRLVASGLRPINNVVDITNYCMLETGQPLHAFDAAKVIGPINIRSAYLNESIETLDGVERKLNRDMLMIADSKKPLAIAGVIGGKTSMVDNTTSEVILESANFQATSIRSTAKQLGLRTDASMRFERSLPPTLVDLGLQLAAEMLVKYSKAKISEYATTSHAHKPLPKVVLDPQQVNALLGTKLTPASQKKVLKNLGFKIQGDKSFSTSVPFWRPDVHNWHDLAEEIARFEGLEKIPSVQPVLPSAIVLNDQTNAFKNLLSDYLVGLGFDEIYTYSFVSNSDLDKWTIDKRDAIEVANPISSDQNYMRPNLAINVLKISEDNLRFTDQSNHFEIGNIFTKKHSSILEKPFVVLVSAEKTELPLNQFLGRLRSLLTRMNVNFTIIQTAEQTANIESGGIKIGDISTISSPDSKSIYANIDLELLQNASQARQYITGSKYPSIILDQSIIVHDNVDWKTISDLVSSHQLVQEVLLTDTYTGKGISLGKKSITIRIRFGSNDRTLTDSEASKGLKEILNNLQSKIHAQIRD